jgi:cobalamin transport system substrate-binding protein
MKKYRLLLLIIYCFLTIPVTSTNARVMVDQTGAKVDLPTEPQRVISLAPGLTEMIYALQAEDKLVGVTLYSNFPEPAKNIPRIGSYVQPDLEKIVSKKPDLCIAIKDGNPRRVAYAIKDLGIPVFALNPQNIDQIMDAFLLLGDILGVSKRAKELVADMEQRIVLVKREVASSNYKPRVFFQIADIPLISSGKDSYIDNLIKLAGGSNIAGGSSGYPRFSWENIMLLQPEVVIISSMTGGKSPELLKAAWQRWPEIPAVRNKRIHVVNADLFNRPTDRLISGLEILAQILIEGSSKEIN